MVILIATKDIFSVRANIIVNPKMLPKQKKTKVSTQFKNSLTPLLSTRITVRFSSDDYLEVLVKLKRAEYSLSFWLIKFIRLFANHCVQVGS